MKIIRDAVHQNIEVNAAELAVLDTPDMQRLRYVRQLGLAYLVYPSATHNRFEHSLGTFHLTSLLSERLFPSKSEQQLLRFAALLHDVGHSAFSHLSEALVRKHAGKTHEQLGEDKIKRSSIADVLKARGFSPTSLLKLMRGPKAEVISNAFGTDRIDYLLRDAHFTGVSYSLVDAERLLRSMAFSRNQLVLRHKGLLSAESLLVSRYLMFRAVYHHHANRIASKMMENALENALEESRISIGDIQNGLDHELLLELRDLPLVQRILDRRLFKTAFVASDFDARSSDKLENELAQHIDSSAFVVCASSQTLGGSDLPVLLNDGKLVPLQQASFIAKAIFPQLKETGLLVAALPEHREVVQRICRKFV
ncbi:HD domain-containing protein [Candidatus Micrarchaeota archaeon]|nr:HD domain-containing protein [Candidatus Micrarchaeota archaeon]